MKITDYVMRPYEEHHFQDTKDVGVAFNHDRIWVCINGAATLRAKVMPDGKLFVEYYKPEDIEES